MKIEKLVMDKEAPGYFQPGVTKTEDGVYICTAVSGKEVSVAVFEEESGEDGKGKREKKRIFPFPENSRMGRMRCMKILGDDFSGLTYSILADGKEIPDVFGRSFEGREVWGELSHTDNPLRSRFELESFDWEGDSPLNIPYEEMILYRIHTRGFTMRAWPEKEAEKRAKEGEMVQPGTFRAIGEKISYLKELGVTSLELMPPNEFEEVMMPDGSDGNPYGTDRPTGKLNYWGYTPGMLFAPKASYASGVQSEKNPVREFKELVKKLHKNGLEIIIELFFTGRESAAVILETVRFWVREYHVDGVHLVGIASCPALKNDPWLSETKLFAAFWDEEEVQGRRHLAEYNDGFMVDMRRLLKGDEDQMNNLIFRSRRNPRGYGVINYMANTNGFTLMDAVTYEMKHNEQNGENNQDGSSWNYTWNCGVEGPSRRKKVAAMRRKQIRNALLILFLSQGTPLLLSGDEFGFSKGGNNNSYCQDNETSWLDWELLKTNSDIYQFAKQAIAFRKKHPVFHMPQEPKVMDYLACGHPDVSYHGVKAWCPEFENFRRQLGIMYCGEYAKKADRTPDDYFFVAYNMHWEPHEFALPKLPKGMKWHLAFNTDDKDRNGIWPEGEEPCLEQQKQFLVPSRTIVVFIGLKEKADEKKGEKQKEKKSAGKGRKENRG